MVNKYLYPKGGSEVYMMKLGKQLQEFGHEVQYFGMEHPENVVGNTAGIYTRNLDFSQEGSLGIRDVLELIYSKEARIKIRALIMGFNPDIVHMHNINFQLTPSIIYEIKKYGLPLVQTVHDAQLACPNHRLYNEKQGKGCQRCIKGSLINCIRYKCVKDSYLKSGLAAFESVYYHERKTYLLIDMIISPSRFLTNVIKQSGVEIKAITTLHNFADPSDGQSEGVRAEKLEKRGKYILYFGRLSAEKGIMTLMEACKATPDIHYVIAGSGPLEDMVMNIPNVEFVGYKSGSTLHDLVSNAAATVYPSEWYENCPFSIIESHSFGTPVIGSNMGGIPELIIHGKDGFMFDAGDAAGLVHYVRQLHDNDALREEMSRNSLLSSVDSIGRYADKIVEIYKKLV